MTTYRDLEITFKLENGLITRYKIDSFTTKQELQPPTGKVADFVSKIYSVSLGRDPEVEGWKFWVQKLESKELPVTQFIYGLMKQDEFISRYLSKEEFVKMMYKIVVGRDPEEEGQKYWEGKYDEYKLQVESLAELRIGTPSMTYKGWLLPTTERMPRIRTLEELPRPEAALFICTPATFPASVLIIFGSFTRFSSSPSTCSTE